MKGKIYIYRYILKGDDERDRDGVKGKKKNWQLFCGSAAGMQDDLDTQIARLYRRKKGER